MKTLIDELLSEQAVLQTPVALFSETHGRGNHQGAQYRQLIPLGKPASGEQYAFEVALDRCTGCKACVSACHSLNGLDDNESWRDVGLLLGGEASPTWQQTVTTACHHCEEPGCLYGCPVGAYEKDAITGIVRHLDDQCIGCSYCILKCPYDVPKYSKKRGIVRKCDMCHQRLAVGEAPACVQACPTEAIRIVKTSVGEATKKPRHMAHGRSRNNIPPRQELFPSGILHPQSAIPDFSITRPTTRYTGRAVPTTAYTADRDALTPQHAHWPLVFMLVLTQAGIGLYGGALLAPLPPLPLLIAGAMLLYLGMAASVLHLGQPLKAWRFFLGLKTSWLSREILAFSLVAPLPLLIIALTFVPDFPFKNLCTALMTHAFWPAGLVAIFTSVMIYHDTHRALWHFPRTALRFFGSTASFAALAYGIIDHSLLALTLLAAVILIKLVPELFFLRYARSGEWSPDRQSAHLQLGPLRLTLHARIALAIIAIATAWPQPWAAALVLLVAELLERQLFFQSVQAPKMTGHPSLHQRR